MLEYALKQERAKFHKLKYGVELQQGDVRPPPEEPPAEPEPAERAQWKQGRQLIKQYLQVHYQNYDRTYWISKACCVLALFFIILGLA